MKQLLINSLREVDELLRGERTTPQLLAEKGLDIRARRMVFVVIAMGMIYGLCMGSFSLLKTVPPALADTNDRYMQVFASVVKTPALFFLTLLVTLPSLYVFNALVGSRLRPLGMFRLLFASLAVNTTVLASLGPIVAFFSVSTSSHAFIVLLNVAVFAVAGTLGLMFLLQTLHRMTGGEERRSKPIAATAVVDAVVVDAAVDDTVDEVVLTPVASDAALETSAIDMPEGEFFAQHTRTVFRCWVVLFALVGAQMGWVMRPFIGTPELPFSWFRERDSNFFASVLGALRKVLLGD
ncbi:hypothetical protein [Lacipirellula sp.]|uniref:hypothetical protein n=1 Tax=Lacipirellula sp. TaxID=2691419 RepID=UPI003D0A3FD9